jgi:hypothetical protein
MLLAIKLQNNPWKIVFLNNATALENTFIFISKLLTAIHVRDNKSIKNHLISHQYLYGNLIFEV